VFSTDDWPEAGRGGPWLKAMKTVRVKLNSIQHEASTNIISNRSTCLLPFE